MAKRIKSFENPIPNIMGINTELFLLCCYNKLYPARFWNVPEGICVHSAT